MCQWNHGRKGLLNSFPGDRIADNACITLNNVALPPPPPPSSSNDNFPTTYNSDSKYKMYFIQYTELNHPFSILLIFAVILLGDNEWDAPEVEGNGGRMGVRGALVAPDIAEGQILAVSHHTTERETDDDVASALMMHDYSMTEDGRLSIQVCTK